MTPVAAPGGVNGTVRRHGFTFNDAGLPYQATTCSDTSGSTVLTQDLIQYSGLQQETQEYQSNSGAVVTGSTGSPLASGPTPTPSVQYGFTGPGTGQNYSRPTSMAGE